MYGYEADLYKIMQLKKVENESSQM